MTEVLNHRVVISMAERGECFLCPRSGFRKLSQHLAMAHGVKADEVRERYGLSWTQPLASPEFREDMRRALEARGGVPGRGYVPDHKPSRTRQQAQTRESMAEVANRQSVRARLVARNQDPAYKALRAEGLRVSESAARQRAEAREAMRKKRRSGAT